MQFIEDHEDAPRRWYGGAVGTIGFDGSMNTGLTLRTAHIRDGVAAVRAGATLLFDSDPAAEERETQIKARALLDTLASPQRRPAGTPAARPDGPAAGQGLRVVVVDHQDSFVHTLGDYFRQQAAEVTTLRAGFDAALLGELDPDLVVLSPGPGRPSDFGCDALLAELDARRLPAFGVCLGLQAMVEHAGGSLAVLAEPWHGKPGLVRVRGRSELLAGLPAEFTAARYHSLYAPVAEAGGGFAVTAAAGDVAMAIENAAAGRWAVQFHPESILTAAGRTGHLVIANVLRLCRESLRTGPAARR
jgi:anthranilate synthase